MTSFHSYFDITRGIQRSADLSSPWHHKLRAVPGTSSSSSEEGKARRPAARKGLVLKARPLGKAKVNGPNHQKHFGFLNSLQVCLLYPHMNIYIYIYVQV